MMHDKNSWDEGLLGANVFLGHDAAIDNGEAPDARQYNTFQNFGAQRCSVNQADLSCFQERLSVFAPQSNRYENRIVLALRLCRRVLIIHT